MNGSLSRTVADGDRLRILLVEDLRTDAILIQRALEKGGIVNPIDVVRDGQQAIDYLLRRDDAGDPLTSPLPGLILLDLKLPKVDGFQVLRKIKDTEILKRIPVVILTSSDQSDDIDKAYDIGANSYLVKPVTSSAFIEVASKIRMYWLMVNTPPSLVT